ncbi:MAG: hypothetical protein ACYDGN_02885 [Acidimicrobiales bacterium]
MIPVPPEVVATLAGHPAVGALDQAFVLVTVDDEGVPDICLLSRSEMDADSRQVRAVVAGRKARANLARSGRATLIVVAGGVPTYLALRCGAMVEREGAVGVALSVTRVLRDDIGIELHPIMFRVEERLAATERWDRSTALLGELRRLGGDGA